MKIVRRILLPRATWTIVLTLFTLGGTLHAAGAAASGPVVPGSSTTIHFADLDLSQPGAVEELHRRIQRAARRVCNASINFHYLRTAPARHECYRLTVADAVSRANLVMLTSRHEGR